MNRYLRAICAGTSLSLALLLVACADAEQPAGPPRLASCGDGGGAVLVYGATSDFDETFDVFGVDTVGRPLQLTTDFVSFDPDLSPDGERIVFVRLQGPGGGTVPDAARGLWTMASDGSDEQKIADLPGIAGPQWSPDGSRFALVAADQTGTAHVHLVNGDGSDFRRASRDPTAPGDGTVVGEGPVTWSPDGRQLAFARGISELEGEASEQLVILPLDGAGEEMVVAEVAEGVSNLSWSADGRRLVFGTSSGSSEAGPRRAVAAVSLPPAPPDVEILVEDVWGPSVAGDGTNQIVYYDDPADAAQITIRIQDLRSGESTVVAEVEARPVASLSVAACLSTSPAGRS